MTLLIAWILIVEFDMGIGWWLFATAVWVVHLAYHGSK